MAPMSLPQSNLPISHFPSAHTTYHPPFQIHLQFKPNQHLDKTKKIEIPCNLTTSAKPITKKNPTTNKLFRSTEKPPEKDKLIKGEQPHSGISSNMWWADLKSAVGQRFHLEGIISSVKVVAEQPQLALPHASVPDIRWVDWSELQKRGFRGVVFDKDNTITVPYVLALSSQLGPSIERCKAVFGDDNVAVFSNSAGLSEFDPDESKARVLERQVGIKVIRHRVKKPAGNAKEIEKHFGCSSSMLVMVGDRHLTDIVYGNRNGFLTILTKPLSVVDEPFIVRQVRKIEECLVSRWHNKGVKPLDHVSGLQQPQEVVCMTSPYTRSP